MSASVAAQMPTFADAPPVLDRTMFDMRLGMLRNERSSWVDHWIELSDYILPRRGRFLQANSGAPGSSTETNWGGKKNNKIIDSTGTISARTLASGMMAGITSPARPWFKLKSPDPELMKFGVVREWYEAVEIEMYRVFAKSNLYNALPQMYEEMGVFGTGAMIELEDFEDVVRFEVLTVGEYMIDNSYRLVADTLYREFQMTVQQIFQKFCDSDKKKAERIMAQSTFDMLQRGNIGAWVNLVHLIEPNDDRLPERLVASHMPWRSVYYEIGMKNKTLSDSEKKKFLRVSGFNEFPVMAPRWHITGQDVYGRSPGMDALGDIKQLQLEQKRKAQGIDKQINPPMVAPPSLRNARVSILPGDITYVDTQGPAGQPAFRPAFQVNFDLGHITADIKDVQDRVKTTMYTDLFLMLAQSDLRYMTAREVSERHEEKLLALGPVLERLHDELLDPLIMRTYNIMKRAQMLPPPPPEIQKAGMQIEYISLLAQAQKQVATVSIETTLSFAAAAVQLDPKAANVIDVPASIRAYADARGAPVKMIRTEKDVKAINDAQQKQEDLAKSTAMAQQGADIAQQMADTDTGSKNLLTDITKNAAARAGAGMTAP